jgi:Na+/H+ antiporter NhaA
MIRLLHPWSAYLVLPIFALANAECHRVRTSREKRFPAGSYMESPEG